MCNNCNGGCPGLLNLLFGRPSNCGCNNGNGGCGCGCGCNGGNRSGNNGCGCYDSYYAAQYALTPCGYNGGCNSCGNTASTFSNGGVYGFMTTSSGGCGCNGGCNSCGNNGCGCNG